MQCGVDRTAPATTALPPDVDRESSLMRAAAPVLADLEQWLEGTDSCLLLAERSARIVDRRHSGSRLGAALDEIGARVGSVFTEELIGTNAIGTAYELRRPIIINGPEHFREQLKQFSCYGQPIFNGVTRRLEGVLQISGLGANTMPLWIPVIGRAVRDIEDALRAGSRMSEQRMLAAYQEAAARIDHPVIALGDGTLLANEAAIDILTAADYATLRGLGEGAASSGSRQVVIRLASGRESRIRVSRVPDVRAGFICELDLLERAGPARRERHHASARRSDGRLDELRRSRVPVLVSGEPGSGRTTLLERLAGEVPFVSFDVAATDEANVPALIRSFRSAMTSHRGLVALEGVHLLDAQRAERLSAAAAGSTAWLAFSSGPVSELGREQAALAAMCVERIEVQPLRHRREEIADIVAAMLKTLEPEREFQVETGLWDVLMTQQWPGNLRELKLVLEYILAHRRGCYLAVENLPEAYRVGGSWRRLGQLEQVEYDTIVRALRDCDGNKVKAAKALGIGRTTLYNRMRALGVRS
jgi:transcriptional regulator of acetoin/glycerol metabolism